MIGQCLANQPHPRITAAAAACAHGPGGLGCRDRARSMHAEQYVGMVAGWRYGTADADTYTSSVHNIHSYISYTGVRHSLHA
jgi:hypothetical protein